MKKIFQTVASNRFRLFFLTCLVLGLGNSVFSQQTTTVLPNNSSYSDNNSPQGALRYQRGFYLVTPAEMRRSGMTANMPVNSIGFTIARAQNDTTQGHFKLYLQNTDDTISRADTGWNVISSTTNSYSATGLFPGQYEWQVQANCGGNSSFTPSVRFSNDKLDGCNNPYNLTAISIAPTTALLSWEAAASTGLIDYELQYSRFDIISWNTFNTTDTFYTVTGLDPGIAYQWRVKTSCSTGSSSVSSSTFTTTTVSACNAPVLYTAVVTNDSLVNLSWSSASGIAHYEVRYRRAGTNAWSNTLSVTESIDLILKAGTTYEWQVRTICDPVPSSGDYVVGDNFNTGGTLVCYEPTNLVTRQITDSSANFTWSTVVGAASYTIRYRLKNTISWGNVITPASPVPAMIPVCDSMIAIPDTTGAYDIPFEGGSPFIYDGRGVYVAWEFSRPAGALSSANLSLSTTDGTVLKGANGQDSITYLLGMVSRADTGLTALPDILGESRLRPETRFGSIDLKDSVAVVAVYALGMTTPRFQSPTPVSALIANKSATDKNIDVTFRVLEKLTSAERYSTVQNIAVTANDSAMVYFNGWSPTILEQDSIVIEIPAEVDENVINNNRKAYLQDVNAIYLAYDDGSTLVREAGLDTLAGLLLNKHSLSGCGQVISARIYLTESALNRPLKAVVTNASGTIVSESPEFTPQASDLNKYHSFYFTSAASFLNEDFYIGLSLDSSVTVYNPVGVQWEDAVTRSGAYFRADIDGSNLTDYPQQGRLMIRAEIASAAPEAFIDGNLVLCSGATNVLTAGSANSLLANRILGYSSQYENDSYSASQVLGNANVFPVYALSPNSWVSATPDGQREYLEIGFADSAYINFVDVYETAGPGAIDSVFVKNPGTNLYELVYSTNAAAEPAVARRNRINFTLTSFKVSEIRIAINSPAVPGYNAIDAVAMGIEELPGAFTSYLWLPGNENTDQISVTTPGVYTLTVTNANGCQFTDTVTVTAAVTTLPVITASGTGDICQGDSITLSSSQATGNTWSPGGQTTQSITVSAAGTYTVSYNDGSGCGVLTSTPFVVIINPLPTVNITGTLEICQGSQTVLDAGAGYNSYIWSTGDVTQTTSVNTAGQYFVAVTNNNGCRNRDSVTTTYVTLDAPVITGTLNFCEGGSTVLDAGAGYTTYNWSTGATTRTITVTTAETFFVTVTNNLGCSSSSSVTTIFETLADPVITGNLIFCPGGSTVLDAGAGYSSYLWSTGATTRIITVTTADYYEVTVTNGGGCSAMGSVNTSLFTPPVPSISGAPGYCAGGSTTLTATPGYASYIWSNAATSESITVGTAGTYTVTVTDNNGCTGSKSITIGEFPNPPPAISGTLSFCGGTSTTLNAGPGYSSYLWSTGATTQNIVVSTVATFTVTVVNANGCSASASVTTTNTGSLPNTPGPITGPVIGSCNSSGNNYSISPVPNTSHYVWNIPSGATIISGQGTTSISVNFGAGFQGGNIVVAASNACGQSPSISPRKLFVQALANVPGAITGQSLAVCGPTTKTYSIAPVSMANSYTWFVPPGASIMSGQGTTSVTVSFSAGFSYGNICVQANNACGSTLPSCKLVSGVSPVPGAIRGPDQVCKNQSNLMYEIDPVAGATSYTWTVPQGAHISFGQGSTNIVVKMGPHAGNITVKANSACGSSASGVMAISIINCYYAPPVYTMEELRPVPEVVSSYGGFASAGAINFEWTLGEPRIESVKKPDYLFTQGFHQPLVYYIPVIQKDTTIFVASDKLKVIVYPNPISSMLKVQVESTDRKGLVLDLVDMNGHSLQRKRITVGLNKNLVEFQMSGYIGGSYYLLVRDSGGQIVTTVKLVKVD